ncbi:hypothetical protein [Acetobacter senegalensis]|uniref:hypothetical protein n=1 Tax=Acetobacter senegalensis TaxID=446692 RepID=UPI00264A7AF5|nr:hypothetical protein [Acetobacter senegalensis]MDN7351030.1 hypothetical protein [Acetobacter senegalensis]
MNAAELSAILGVVTTVAGLAEKYGPEVYETVKSALEQSRSSTGPTGDDLKALFAKCQADNAAIQAS